MALLVETDVSLVDVSKQATKALKCVAFTSRQVGEMLERKHERILKRIRSISEEIESLKTDVMENITHQRERRAQLTEIEEDVERAQLLGNAALVEDLLEELRVLKDEAKREDSLYRALCKTVRSRKESKRQFMHERLAVEDEIRNFTCKQKLIETLLATCSKQSFSSDNTQGSSASQSDCGASALDDRELDGDDVEADNASASSSSTSFPENPFDSPVMRPAEPLYPERLTHKSVSLDTTPVKRQLRVRSFSTDCAPVTHRESVHTRPRHSLSVHFASPVLMYETRDEELAQDLESLDLSSMGSIDETSAPAEEEEETKGPDAEEAPSGVESTPGEPQPQDAQHETTATPEKVEEPLTLVETPPKTVDTDVTPQPLMDGAVVPASATGTAAA